MPVINSHRRVNDILLGPIERPALKWLASHMPAWVTPDHLTTVGLIGSIIVFISYWLTNYHPGFLWVASLGFFINWFGDSLDGTLARFRHIERPRYGFFIDHSLDSISIVLVFLGLGLSPYVRFEIASMALVGYLLMSVHVYVRTCVDSTFKISYAGLGPTEVRAIAILTNAATFFAGNALFTFNYYNVTWSATIYDMVGIFVSSLLIVIFLLSTFSEARLLASLGE